MQSVSCGIVVLPLWPGLRVSPRLLLELGGASLWGRGALQEALTDKLRHRPLWSTEASARGRRVGRRESRHREDGVCGKGVWGGHWGREDARSLGPALGGSQAPYPDLCGRRGLPEAWGSPPGNSEEQPCCLETGDGPGVKIRLPRKPSHRFPCFSWGCWSDGRAKKFSDSWKERLSCVCFKQTDLLSETRPSQSPA